jgi:hypothetical protein
LPSCELAVQTGEAALAICSRLGLTVSVQVPVQTGEAAWASYSLRVGY